MLIVLPIQPFIMFVECFWISIASIHLRSPWYLMFLYITLQVISSELGLSCLFLLLWLIMCLDTVWLSIDKCPFIRDPMVLPVSPMYCIPQCRHFISYTTFFLKHWLGLVALLHVRFAFARTINLSFGSCKHFRQWFTIYKTIFHIVNPRASYNRCCTFMYGNLM